MINKEFTKLLELANNQTPKRVWVDKHITLFYYLGFYYVWINNRNLKIVKTDEEVFILIKNIYNF